MAIQLMKPIMHESRELNLSNRLQSAKSHAEGATKDARFRDWRIDNPLVAKTIQQPFGDTEYTAYLGDVFAQDDDLVIPFHLFMDGLIQGFHHIHDRHCS